MRQSKEITKRNEDYSQWYLDIIKVAGLAEYAPVKGCMIIKPYGYSIWENIQKILDSKFKETGVENAYFPLFIPESFLKKEAAHVEGFAPELAVVTHAGGKKLDEPLIVRPTSETIMYDVFSKWIHSYRDLPLLINQWANVVRWEMRTRLFLRTTEFLWQEGHTVHATEKEAEDKTMQMIEIYKSFVQDYLAMPVLIGKKSDSEKFAGAVYTTSIEAMMQDKKALQTGTSHMLGQNFAKVFGVKFLDQNGKEEYGWQTSWGVSTRIIGGLIMMHSDDKGLVLPPKIAPIKVVIVPIWNKDEERDLVLEKAKEIALNLENVLQSKIKIDDRDMRPGPKFFEWEKKGVPVRLEVGPKEIEKKKYVVVRRDTGEKENIDEEKLGLLIPSILDNIQNNLFSKALEFQKDNTFKVDSWDEFKETIEKGGFISAHWCGNGKCEEKIKEGTKATIRSVPFDQKKEKGKCVFCGGESEGRVIFAKSY